MAIFNSLSKRIFLSNLAIILTMVFCFFNSQSFSYVMKAVFFNFLILLVLYAIRAFELQTVRSLNKAFTTFLIGTSLGGLFTLIPILYYRPAIPMYMYLTFLLVYMIFLPFINYKIAKNFIKNLPSNHYLIIGKDDKTYNIMDKLCKISLGKIRPVMYINPDAAVLENLVFDSHQINSVLVADMKLKERVEPSLDRIRLKGKNITYLPHVVENSLAYIPLDVINKFTNYYEVAFEENKISPVKRLYDLILSSFLLLIFSPLILLFGIALYIESGGPVIFCQERVGYQNKKFIIYKLRTLTDVDVKKTGNPNEGIEKRATRVGNVMRKLRIDELPQLVNVLKGEMSLIGPRPEMVEFHDMCVENIPFYSYRNLSKPGITGWAQMNYKHTTTLEDYRRKTEYDLYYIKNQNMIMDLQITLRTIVTMLGMKGSR
ncbi:sugar transferase [Candidatus Contubernalis alkaliaceticus]|uniref:sugar transferase n=1 Tax=Candidatus Contubernalis alkaliaceticus TaxID=338645 RepID=UPI001F4BE8D7|nr:sugar transferase [Candidatus Contubernalis alkalaceticus]UNC93479.1 sugar transferase [Candidatus Contubernalis alkalaceticus]